MEKMNNKNILDVLELMEKDAFISLDNEIIEDQYKFGLIDEKTYKELIEDNRKAWNKLYEGE